MPPAIAPLFVLLLSAGPGADEPLVSVRRVPAPAEAALVDAAVRAAGPAAVPARDDLAYRLLALGYSARETADIVAGRASKRDVDLAHARRLAGYPEPPPVIHPLTISAAVPAGRPVAVAVRAPRPPSARPVTAAGPVAPPPLAHRPLPFAAAPLTAGAGIQAGIDAAIDRYARQHDVDPDLVRAIIGEESGFSHAARSPVGAVGLMQLMPATARHLGVNPYVMEQNIEGGVRYLSEQLHTFGRLELAIIAYNAGPVMASRYARGEIGLYTETRGYLARVLARLRASR